MGFDLYGIDPKCDKPEPPVDWNDPDSKSRDEYYKWREGTKGAYFRNNNWWWRPLWMYINSLGLLTEEQYQRGQYNDGYKFASDQAIKIGARLKHEVAQGKTKKWADNYKEESKLAKASGDNFGDAYPFDVNNVKEFADFCIESGGFEIC
jgi:hypothetical protein